jgi:hypothetical protein
MKEESFTHNWNIKRVVFLSSIRWKREGTTHLGKASLSKHKLIESKPVFQRPPKVFSKEDFLHQYNHFFPTIPVRGPGQTRSPTPVPTKWRQESFISRQVSNATLLESRCSILRSVLYANVEPRGFTHTADCRIPRKVDYTVSESFADTILAVGIKR